MAETFDGPWHEDPSSRDSDLFTWVFDCEGNPVTGASGRITRRKAKLIAAAPDLYEALEAIANEQWTPTQAQCKKARAALDKARGKHA